MADDLSARVLVCGKVTGYQGRYPGILEEALISLERNQPLYPLGGFGGITNRIVTALLGESPVELTEQMQTKNENYAGMLAHYRKQRQANVAILSIDYQQVVKYLNKCGLSGLNNGLTNEQNQILVHTRNMEQAMGLVFEGLRKVFGHGSAEQGIKNDVF